MSKSTRTSPTNFNESRIEHQEFKKLNESQLSHIDKPVKAFYYAVENKAFEK
jgi:hypothetical protein